MHEALLKTVFLQNKKRSMSDSSSINIDKGNLQIGIKTYIMQFIATVSITITGCSIYYGIIISDLKTQLNSAQLEKNQLLISRRLDSTGTARNLQLEKLIRDNELLKEKLGIKE